MEYVIIRGQPDFLDILLVKYLKHKNELEEIEKKIKETEQKYSICKPLLDKCSLELDRYKIHGNNIKQILLRPRLDPLNHLFLKLKKELTNLTQKREKYANQQKEIKNNLEIAEHNCATELQRIWDWDKF